MSPIIILALCFSLVLTIQPPTAAAAAADTPDAPTAYDLLQSYGFPAGLLPKGVKGYDLDETTGKFNLYLSGSCSFSLEGSYQLKYKSTVSGHIKKNKLTNVSGVSVKVLFLWLNIVEVDRSDDEIEFSVGIASANFPIENFEICPQCGCGLNCYSSRNNGQIRKIKSNPLISSV